MKKFSLLIILLVLPISLYPQMRTRKHINKRPNITIQRESKIDTKRFIYCCSDESKRYYVDNKIIKISDTYYRTWVRTELYNNFDYFRPDSVPGGFCYYHYQTTYLLYDFDVSKRRISLKQCIDYNKDGTVIRNLSDNGEWDTIPPESISEKIFLSLKDIITNNKINNK